MRGVINLEYADQVLIIQFVMTYYLTASRNELTSSRRSFDLKSETSTEGEENDCLHEVPFNNNLASSGRSSAKAKTSLCKNFTEKGYCSYGKKCQFAHGPQQLRVNMEHNRSYKTKTCHAFTKKGFCHYGERCNFIHQQTASQELVERWQTIYSNHRSTIFPGQFLEKSRLLNLLGK